MEKVEFKTTSGHAFDIGINDEEEPVNVEWDGATSSFCK